ncbi:MAG: arylsulfatase [Sphingorhabdus sp.]
MRRRLALTAFPALALSTASVGQPSEPRRPNIVILLADDWGFTDVGSFGSEIRTPHIDALAAKGVRFSNFHVAGSCSPTRAMLQTGVINHRAGLGNMPETIPPEHLGRPGYETHLNDRVVTIADQLRRGGYRTYLTGKWHLGHTPATLPTARGYDHAFALSQSGADNFEEKPNLLLYNTVDWSQDGKAARLPKTYYSSTFIVEKMIAYIDGGKASGKPFFASLNFLANHIPVQAPSRDIAAYAGRYSDGWTTLRRARQAGAVAQGVLPAGIAMVTMATTGDWKKLTAGQRLQRSNAMSAYAAMATAMDREVGRLVAHLKATGVYENTIFVFLSDNGPEPTDPMAAGGITTWNTNRLYDQRLANQGRPGSLTAIGVGFASAAAAPLRGYKFTASEGGLRVPLIVAWPGNSQVQSGAVADGFAHVTDLAPTLLSLADVEPQKGYFEGRRVEPMTGLDLTPMLTGKAGKVGPDTRSLGYELSGNAVLFKGDYKLVKNIAPYGDGKWRLYNISRDPGEAHDLSVSDPARFISMQADYVRFAKTNAVLEMPEGYTAPKQIFQNAMRNVLVPGLLGLWPFALGLLGVAVGLIWWRHRRCKLG